MEKEKTPLTENKIFLKPFQSSSLAKKCTFLFVDDINNRNYDLTRIIKTAKFKSAFEYSNLHEEKIDEPEEKEVIDIKEI